MPAEVELHDAIALVNEHLAIEHVRAEILVIIDAVKDEDRALRISMLRRRRATKLGAHLPAKAGELQFLFPMKRLEAPAGKGPIRRTGGNPTQTVTVKLL